MSDTIPLCFPSPLWLPLAAAGYDVPIASSWGNLVFPARHDLLCPTTTKVIFSKCNQIGIALAAPIVSDFLSRLNLLPVKQER